MALIYQDGEGQWAFKHGKHIGKTLDEVARDSPGYLRWMFDAKATYDLSDDAFHALEDIMEKYDIEVP